MFGIGAFYDEDMTTTFVEQNCCCIGYDKGDASILYEMLRRIKLGEIIYIKSLNRTDHSINIKAIGFVNGKHIQKHEELGYGRNVIWVKVFSPDNWIKVSLSKEDFKNNVYNNTLYEEYSESVINAVLDVLKNVK